MKKLIIGVVAILFLTQGFSQCACCAGAGAGIGVSNGSILTVPKKVWIAEAYNDYRTIQNGNAPEDDEKLLKNMLISSVGVRYGITNKITISALMPYVFLYTGSGNDRGLGDLMVLGTFSVYNKNRFNVALQTGLKLPTGVQKESNFDNTTVIVGSGSYDPMVGLSFSKNWNKFSLQGNGIYKYTTKGFQGNYYGSLAIQSVSMAYKITGENNICSGDTKNLNGINNIGFNVSGGYLGEWHDKIKEDNIVDENSGYYVGFATLGTTVSANKWAFPLTISLPIINNLNGEQNNNGYRLKFGIIKSF